ncbi:hypothetical protein BN1058_02321 [Paraliobacillus sp. PM-2]|uniref:CotO family spore coat protein n=1 Tax=Paraliobacillus sp. PM-2 TaxID=1462524 RepID=UPI00061BB19F|nr:CotO family spore coat protein [Paraliobacillus sp. PM-2]CQR47984.1 hypothetical protein BN1058_02321 [Paraliobacillus sp. PM-2]
MSRKKRNSKRRPMLYIDQPDLEAPTPNMQEDYHTPKQTKRSTTNIERPIKRPKSKKGAKKNNTSIEEDEFDTFFEDEKNETVDAFNEEDNESKDQNEGNDIQVEEEISDDNVGIETNRSEEKVPFTEMSLIEQVDYLAASPGFMPKLKCEIITKDERLKGIIRKRSEETVYIETFRRPRYHQVSLDDIKSIRLLGF